MYIYKRRSSYRRGQKEMCSQAPPIGFYHTDKMEQPLWITGGKFVNDGLGKQIQKLKSDSSATEIRTCTVI